MSLNDTEKINYIKNNFHQYFDLTLNKKISTPETVNLIIPMEVLTNEDVVFDPLNAYTHDTILSENYAIEDILSKYEDTDLKGIKCICTRVIDGDTIDVKIPKLEKDGSITYSYERIRLVGVNTPEMGNPNANPPKEPKMGALVSKKFMEKVCYSKNYLQRIKKEEEYANMTQEDFDNLSPTQLEILEDDMDRYSQIENNKVIYIKFDSKKTYASKSKSYDNGVNRKLAVLIVDNKNINEVLLKENLAEIMYVPPSEFYPFDWGTSNTSIHVYNFQNTDINFLYPYFNSDMTNVVFTPRDDPKTIYRYEFYKGVYYIKLQPFCQNIRMHLLPKAYDCSNTILFFRDDMLEEENMSKSDDYYHFPENEFINSYYMVEGKIRNREEDPNILNQQYNVNDWNNTFIDFSYNISDSARNLNQIEICAGYRYNQATPDYSVHFTGIRDNTNIQIEDRCTLIDANFDKIESKANNITQYLYDNQNNLYIPKNPIIIRGEPYPQNIDHVTEIGKIYHKRLKYINDILYSEEGLKSDIQHTIASWVDVSR